MAGGQQFIVAEVALCRAIAQVHGAAFPGL
jgi:hypothetical protein